MTCENRGKDVACGEVDKSSLTTKNDTELSDSKGVGGGWRILPRLVPSTTSCEGTEVTSASAVTTVHSVKLGNKKHSGIAHNHLTVVAVVSPTIVHTPSATSGKPIGGVLREVTEGAMVSTVAVASSLAGPRTGGKVKGDERKKHTESTTKMITIIGKVRVSGSVVPSVAHCEGVEATSPH